VKNNNLLGEHGRKHIALFCNELDALGNITGIKDGNGNHAWFVLDGWERISETHTPDGSVERIYQIQFIP